MSQRIEKAWGWEEVVVNNNLYCGKLLHLKQGARSSIHYHKKKHETFYVLSGRVRLALPDQGKIIDLWETQSVILPAREPHGFYGVEDSVIIEFSTPHSDDDVYRVSQSQEAPQEELSGKG